MNGSVAVHNLSGLLCLCKNKVYNTKKNKGKWNSIEVGQNLVMAFHRLVMMEMASYFTV